ncbi:aminobenzoate oxygenase [Candidatus Marsarchaeota G2 archaeon ECH_B_SAG-F08]|jgi:rubrerythrin|uniref:Aminobenzoate oxygenase n=5 Tax=Candidatus Marsarchaeota TaxID=1978152 RepID=A0A2R6C287_9ARCH|nr:MAG: aminobenzoate oxygenase [Candidatus Marsarchaeota G1 archaeon BE_D]PSN88917.1 MAG: aminobenzoate oxygenase [Candidatus Marsarchaeota G1 archaeon OSP_C]PSN94768.1 MAG: aminobenzoate oxygenase [Candidatus Marsarchaeota G1 archaeon OSP_B]PSO00138.1 MAG: aminobenzoate oxygenase [Candidatus Marsarchaeota G2 archaeon ECH_B_SAG-F08]PSO04866.1 MAG: aminobenzoate oxygenase [Candidatus Marsarchaeota G2 archaeon ECH_B_SAG-G06]
MSTNFDSDPVFPERNIYPIRWDFTDSLAWKLYTRSKREQWDEESLNWERLKEVASGLERKQKLAICYWWALLSTFDNAAPVFAYALVKGQEMHINKSYEALITMVTCDECRHNLLCGRSIQCLLPGFPLDFKPQNDFEEKVRRNVLWTWYNGSRYWNAYKEAYNKYPFDVLLTSFMMGEAAATTVFTEMSKNAKIEPFPEAFRNVAKDETRHYAFTHILMQDGLEKMSEERKWLVTKQIRAGFVFLSLITYKPPKDFWRLPQDFERIHFELEAVARDAGLGVPTLEEKEKAWREAVLRVGAAVGKYGVKMPEIPELGISGEEVSEVSEQDVIPVF